MVQADQVSGTHRGRNVDLVSAVEGNVSVSIKYTFCRQLFAVARRDHFDRDPVAADRTMLRLLRVCGLMGVSMISLAFGSTMGPPADML